MRMRGPMSSLTMSLILGGLFACGSVRPIKYYALEIPESQPKSVTAYPISIAVDRLYAPSLYRDTRLVYGYGPTEMGTYELHRWVEPPAEAIGTFLLRMLRSSGLYEVVEPVSSLTEGDYLIRGSLYDFKEIDPDGGGPAGLAARVSFEIDLLDLKERKTVWTFFYSDEETVHGKEVSSVVEALDRNVRRGLERLAKGMSDFFSSLSIRSEHRASGE